MKMKASILVLAPYPNERNLNDGFIQRVKKMDEFMVGNQRIYIQVSLRKFFKKERVNYGEEVIAYRINFILHWYILLRAALSVNLIYSHTIYNLLWLSYFFRWIKAPIILDVHGTVPEEKAMEGDITQSKKYANIEKVCFEKIDTAIFVTESMRTHYKFKYPSLQYNAINYGIIPDHIIDANRTVSTDILKILKERIGVKDSDTVIVYSGGLHVWQNIDEMLDLINKKQNDENIFYIFLVSNKELMLQKMAKYDFSSKRIYLDSVHPSELKNFYNIGHYGFVLRDDNVVNRVANPTKLIEYLYYGLTPIVKLQEIGDFKSFGYNYLPIDSFSANRLEGKKCLANQRVVVNIFESYDDSKVRKLVS